MSGCTASGKVVQVEKKADQFHFTGHSCVGMLTMHEQVKLTYFLRRNDAHSQEVPQVEKRADHFNFRDYSCVGLLNMNKHVKTNFQSENK